jgi:DNA mismatch repair protein MutS
LSGFIIDQQTLRDLNVFTETSGSVFHIFKGARTMGGREKLREMMSNPSSDLHIITRRSESIKYFHDREVRLDIRNEELDLIEFYLKSTKRRSKENLIDALSDYVTRNSSNDYYIIKTGLKYLIKLAKYLNLFITENQSEDLPEHLNVIFKRITELTAESQLAQALKLNENKLKFYQVNWLDDAFRGKEKQNIQELLQLSYELDVFEYAGFTAKNRGFTFPEYTSGANMQFSVEGLFHPGIKNPVANDVRFDSGQNMVFLTGSNMAGKSSLLKSLGLAIYLAHIGFPVPAKAMKTTVFNGLVTTINLPDNISDGLSHYYSEVKRVKDVALKLTENDRLFVIFDELFRGTNVKDAFDASLMIISELSFIRNSAFFISTHIVELADELQKYPNIAFQQMETFFENDKPVFTYKLSDGISTERLGMYIVLNEGIIDTIRKAAKT